MTNFTRKRILRFSVAAFVVLVFAIFFFPFFSAKGADVNNFSGGELKEVYATGETLDLPEGKFGNNVARTKVYYPDGRIVEDDSVYLDVYGNYRVVYYCSIDGELYREEKTFVAETELYDFSLPESEAYYGTDPLSEKTGLVVSLDKDDVFRYNDIIQLEGASAMQPVLSLALSPQTLGLWDCSEILISLIDAHDEDNRIDIRITLNTAAPYRGSVNARANGQPWTGYSYGAGYSTINVNNY